MAHHPSHRRNLPAPQPNPNPDLIQHYQPSFLVKQLTSLNLTQSHNNSPIIHTHSHAKAMSASTKDKQGAVTVPAKTTHKEKTQRPCLELERRKLGGSDDKGVVEDAKVHKQKPHFEKPDVSVSLGGGRRRSYRGSQVDLRDAFAINGAKMVSADMPPFMQIHAVDSARKAFDSMEKFTSKTLALSLKKEFDGVYGPAWHCIVGTSFGSFVTHSVGGFLYFSMDQKLYILLFKTSVQKAG